MRRSRHASFALSLFSITLLLLSTLAVRGFPVAQLFAAPTVPATPNVVVAPSAGQATDTFTFSLTGFAASEAVSVAFTAPAGTSSTDLPLPDAMTTTVDATGSGSFTLRPVDQGVILLGTWVVTFTGQTSGTAQTASFELDPGSIPGCGCQVPA